MNTRVIIVKHERTTDLEDRDELQQKVSKALARLEEGWEIQSATTHSCAIAGSKWNTSSFSEASCPPSVFWTTTILLRKS